MATTWTYGLPSASQPSRWAYAPRIDGRAGRIEQREVHAAIDEVEVAATEDVAEEPLGGGDVVVATRGVEGHGQGLELVLELHELGLLAAVGEIAGGEDEAELWIGGHPREDVAHAIDGLLHVAEEREAEGALRRGVLRREGDAVRARAEIEPVGLAREPRARGRRDWCCAVDREARVGEHVGEVEVHGARHRHLEAQLEDRRLGPEAVAPRLDLADGGEAAHDVERDGRRLEMAHGVVHGRAVPGWREAGHRERDPCDLHASLHRTPPMR